jgi:hypothetical protein
LDIEMPAAVSAATRFSRPLLWGGAAIVLGGTLMLWAYYGTAVFFEMVRAGFLACF